MSCCELCGRGGEIGSSQAAGAHVCRACHEKASPTTLPEAKAAVPVDRPDPFARPLDQFLATLRQGGIDCRLIPGQPDRWLTPCPIHPDAGPSLVAIDRGAEAPALWCRVGCDPGLIRWALLGDPDLERAAEAVSRALLWERGYTQRRKAA